MMNLLNAEGRLRKRDGSNGTFLLGINESCETEPED